MPAYPSDFGTTNAATVNPAMTSLLNQARLYLGNHDAIGRKPAIPFRPPVALFAFVAIICSYTRDKSCAWPLRATERSATQFWLRLFHRVLND
jgi:hypothetical protein